MKSPAGKTEIYLAIFALLWTLTSAQFNVNSLLNSFLSQRGIVLPQSCSDIRQYRRDCSRRCTDINYGDFGCREGTRRWRCHTCTFPTGYLNRQNQCVTRVQCTIENRILRVSLATLPRQVTTPNTPTITTTTTTTTTPAPTTTTAATTQSPIVTQTAEVITFPNDSRCSRNRILTTCATCDFSCGRRFEPRTCSFPRCRLGCACRPNHFVNELNGNCVPSSQCPPRPNIQVNLIETLPGFSPVGISPFSSSPQCPGDLIRSTCFRCNRTCQDPNPICSTPCLSGCTCPPGLYRNGDSCLTAQRCSVQQGADEISRCGRRCPEGLSCRRVVFNYQCVA